MISRLMVLVVLLIQAAIHQPAKAAWEEDLQLSGASSSMAAAS
jgi:hypothetical protein